MNFIRQDFDDKLSRISQNEQELRIKNNRIIFLISLFCLFIIPLSCLPKAQAQEMKSTNFKIQGGNFNMTSGEKASTNYKLSDVVGQTAAQVFASKGYLIQAGFLNSAAAEVFLFKISPSVVDFGTLSPNAPVVKKVFITIANGNTNGYRVTVAENQPLTTSVGSEIVDTVCDPPVAETSPCTYTQAAKWSENTTYGFGYHMFGKTVPSDFTNDVFFRPFPATRRNEKPITVMESHAKKVTDQAEMTLKVNIGPQQPVGLYRNVLTFTAIAGI